MRRALANHPQRHPVCHLCLLLCRHIVPCGTPDKEVTSVQRELQQAGTYVEAGGEGGDAAKDDALLQDTAPNLLKEAEQHLVRCIAGVYGYTDVQDIVEEQLLPTTAR